MSEHYKIQLAPITIPFVLPVLQTFLTISVYTTVAIAIGGAMQVRSNPNSLENSTLLDKILNFLKFRRVNGTIVSIFLICVFSILFNASRWFEIKTIDTFDDSKNMTIPKLQVTFCNVFGQNGNAIGKLHLKKMCFYMKPCALD